MVCMHTYYAANAARPQDSNGCTHKLSSQSFPRQRALPLAPAVVSNGAMPSRHVQPTQFVWRCDIVCMHTYYAANAARPQDSNGLQHKQSSQSFPRQRAL